MSVSGAYRLRSPEVSGALRYERVARLEAALTLRDKQRRARMMRWTAGIAALAIMAWFVFGT